MYETQPYSSLAQRFTSLPNQSNYSFFLAKKKNCLNKTLMKDEFLCMHLIHRIYSPFWQYFNEFAIKKNIVNIVNKVEILFWVCVVKFRTTCPRQMRFVSAARQNGTAGKNTFIIFNTFNLLYFFLKKLQNYWIN